MANNADKFQVVDIYSALNSKKMQFGLQFLPHISNGAGFYVCKIKKL